MNQRNQDIPVKYEALLGTRALRADLKRRSVRGGAYTFAAAGINFLLQVGSVSILARILLPEHFGLISMVTAVTVIAYQFKDMGLSLATVQQSEITHDQVSTLFWINVLVGLLITCILCGMSYFMGWFYGDPRVVWVTIAISTIFLWGGLTVQHQALLRRQMQYGKIAVIGILANIVGILVGIIFAVTGYGYWALVWREVSGSVFAMIATWMVCSWLPGFPKRNTGIGRMVRFGRDITAFNIITYFTDSLDQILLGKLYGPALVGIYRQAYQLVMVPIGPLTQPVHLVGQSTLSVLQNDDHEFNRTFSKLLTLLSFVTMPLAIFLFVYSREIILLVLGNKWMEAEAIFKIFALAIFVRPALGTVGLVMLTCGNSKRYFYLGLGNSMLIMISMIIGLNWGAVGVAAGHVIENYAVLLPVVVIALRNTPVRVGSFFRSIKPCAMASLLMGFVLYLFSNMVQMEKSLHAMIVSLPIAAVAYIGIWMMMPGGYSGLKEIFSDIILVIKKGEGEKPAAILNEVSA